MEIYTHNEKINLLLNAELSVMSPTLTQQIKNKIELKKKNR